MTNCKLKFFLCVLIAGSALACQTAEDRGGPLLAYVANAGSNHVQVVDLETGNTLRKIYSGITPWRLVAAPDGRALWVQHWSSESTAVIDLTDHEVEAVLPLRGPGILDAEGERFLSYRWPASGLAVYDAATFQELETRTTEVSRAYDLALDASGENLFLVQYDPIRRSRAQRYAYLVSLSLATEAPSPNSVRTGRSPVEVLTVPEHPFVLTADSESESLTLININGDGRTVSTCPSPQRMLLNGDASRLVVLCWDRDEGRHGHAVSYRTDFTNRPWPTFTEAAAVEIDAGLVAGGFVPGEERVWVVDQPGKRLLKLDAATLAVQAEIATGEVPSDLALLQVKPAWHKRLAEKSDSRRRLESAIARLQEAGAPFSGLRWKETLSWNDPPPKEVTEADDAGHPTPRMETRRRQLSMTLAAPARLRRYPIDEAETPAHEEKPSDSAVSLAVGGWTLTVRHDGRYWTAPRQELVSLVYALPNFSLDEAVRRLAGDVEGNPYLAGGLAVDLVSQIEEGDKEYLLVGALKADEPVAQLWIDNETGHPTNLIEKFPITPGRQHEGPAIGGFVETKFYDFATHRGGVMLPSRLERALDGRWMQQVRLEDVEVEPDLLTADFDPQRLAGLADRHEVAYGPATQDETVSDDEPGYRIPVMDHEYLSSPWNEQPPYSSNPPTSGPRLTALADWGVHPFPVPLALQVHNLEHGGVAIQYNCPQGCPKIVAELERLTASYARVIVAPYPLMKAGLALTAWGRMDTLEIQPPLIDAELDEAQEAQIVAFLDRWEGKDHHKPRTEP